MYDNSKHSENHIVAYFTLSNIFKRTWDCHDIECYKGTVMYTTREQRAYDGKDMVGTHLEQA